MKVSISDVYTSALSVKIKIARYCLDSRLLLLQLYISHKVVLDSLNTLWLYLRNNDKHRIVYGVLQNLRVVLILPFLSFIFLSLLPY